MHLDQWLYAIFFKPFCMYPDKWLYAFNRPSGGTIQILNLWILKSLKIYLQWVLNRAQKCQEFNDENRFWIRCFIKELSRKNERN
jgi:hypothetical protein